jgi:predicted nucleic acid-binding Zn ribbon protein
MPVYRFACSNCGFADDYIMTVSELDALDRHPEKGCKIQVCSKCEGAMHQQIGTVHMQVGHSWDGHNPGKVFQEHNEKLKKREGTHADYLTPTDKIREHYLGDRSRNN